MNRRGRIVESSGRFNLILALSKYSRMFFVCASDFIGQWHNKHARWTETTRPIKVGLLLTIVALCLFQFVLHRRSKTVQGFEGTVLSLHWILVAFLAVWSGAFLLRTFGPKDLALISLLIFAALAYFIGYEGHPGINAVVLMSGFMLGRCASLLIKNIGGGMRKNKNSKCETGYFTNGECGTRSAELRTMNLELRMFLLGLILLLAFSSWWHLGMTSNIYHGLRWMGLWNNPNDYGLLMGAGVVLATGLLAERLKVKGQMLNEEKRKAESGKRKLFQILKAESRKQKFLLVFLLVAAGMMGVGLVMSYSRGAWIGTAIGLLYLAKAYGKFKWRWVFASGSCCLRRWYGFSGTRRGRRRGISSGWI